MPDDTATAKTAPPWRLLHVSDTHLGHQQYPRTDPETGLNQREVDHYRAFGQFIDHALATKPDCVIHAGDLFDGVRPSNRALAAAVEGFLSLGRARIPVVVIAGNHEHPRLRETGSPFRLLDHLDLVHPVYKGRRESIEVRPGLTIHAVPQCADAAALRAEVAAIGPAAGRNVLVVHGAVTGLPAFQHAEFNELALDPGWFDDRFDYVALGHFHGMTQITPRAWYSGAPDRVSLAESGQEKGFLEVVLDGASGSAPDVAFHALPGRPYMDLPVVDADGLDADGVLRAAEDVLARVPAGAVVRLRVEGLDASLRGVLDQRAIQKAAAHALHLELRLLWSDDGHRVAGSAELGGLAQEFEAFAATHPIEGLDRQRLLGMARDVLGVAAGEAAGAAPSKASSDAEAAAGAAGEATA